MSVLELKNITFSYDRQKTVIRDLSYGFEAGLVYAIIGKSGAGKTTLLSMLSGLVPPTSGEIIYNNTSLRQINQYDYRSKYVGVIFQSYNLLPHLTAEENVILSMDISGKKIKDKKKKAREVLQSVGLDEELWSRRILKLSGGEQQRVAIARTLSYEPDIILADEPTGNLDGETQNSIMKIFINLAKEKNKCIILVTHSADVAKAADVTYALSKL
ncbi:MAG: ABC transporter ATP-binding protein [Acutalibacteraceae bacterium]